jgi:hypothetical protein
VLKLTQELRKEQKIVFFVRIGKSDSDRAKKGKGVFNEASANKEFSPQAMYNLTHFLEEER